VQNVLDSMVPALLEDKNRKFIYVEQVKLEYYWIKRICICILVLLFICTKKMILQNVVDNRISTKMPTI
jgi:hypothetical protein